MKASFIDSLYCFVQIHVGRVRANPTCLSCDQLIDMQPHRQIHGCHQFRDLTWSDVHIFWLMEKIWPHRENMKTWVWDKRANHYVTMQSISRHLWCKILNSLLLKRPDQPFLKPVSTDNASKAQLFDLPQNNWEPRHKHSPHTCFYICLFSICLYLFSYTYSTAPFHFTL